MASGAYLKPWRDSQRAHIFIVGFLANFGYGTLSFTLNYAMAVEGPMNSFLYQVLRMFMLGYIFVPLTFWFHSKFKSRNLLFLIQLAGLGLFFIDRSSGLINGLAVTLAFAPFLALHNYRFAKAQSRDNRGNETALISFLVAMSYSIGLFLGGFALQFGYYYAAVIGGSLCTMIGSYFLYQPLTGRNNVSKVKSLIGINKPSTRISFFSGLFNVMADGGMPIWMHALGISPLGAGINMSLRPMIGLLLTPVAGWLIQKKGFRAGQLGGAALILGWALMAGAPYMPWILSLGLGVISIGSNLLNPMEVGRWYKRRSSAGIIAREMVIATGRMHSYTLGILVCAFMPATYPLMGLLFGGLFILGTRPHRKGLSRPTLTLPRDIPYTTQ